MLTSIRTETAVEIRPGVYRPDLSVVTAPAARAALGGRTAARAGLRDMWSHALEAAEDLVWRRALRLYGDGRPPRIDEIADGANVSRGSGPGLAAQAAAAATL